MSSNGWYKKSFAEIANYKTGKLNSNQANDKGKYPFFTCSPDPLRINKYAFDQDAVLLVPYDFKTTIKNKLFFKHLLKPPCRHGLSDI